ncbi:MULTISPECIES: NAD(P)H-binding protein [Aeromicrobium]|uniref:NmrA family NAD(P)-binding protein n=1 Tax=Aeromicrobium TaxID=2040 RepID=UPI0007015237|nr:MULTISPECIES: NAD(P)H-binding protein [Aeromicrobium]KQX71752.1 oxidoreductase [Aeromicrobium sp. Root472D3]MCL8251816.1 NAD(P)H-binding protein [Aeromicrobium fastidiosum]
MPRSRTALVTGATGYIGAQVVARLLEDGWTVRVLTRDASGLAGRPWASDVEVVEGDAQDAAVLSRAADGADVAWFLIHSMTGTYEYATRDRTIATRFGQACRSAGVSRIVYLGGLYPDDVTLSPHLESRREVGEILMESGVPTAVLQAGIVVGAGSVSYEMLATATEKLPVVVAPDWLAHRVQPIAIRDALHYLVGAADLPPSVNRAFDIGGSDALAYRDLISVYAEVAGLRRRPILTVPILMPRTTALWAGILAPVPTSLASSLLESLMLDMVCREHDLDDLVGAPVGGALSFREAVVAARGSRD